MSRRDATPRISLTGTSVPVPSDEDTVTHGLIVEMSKPTFARFLDRFMFYFSRGTNALTSSCILQGIFLAILLIQFVALILGPHFSLAWTQNQLIRDLISGVSSFRPASLSKTLALAYFWTSCSIAFVLTTELGVLVTFFHRTIENMAFLKRKSVTLFEMQENDMISAGSVEIAFLSAPSEKKLRSSADLNRSFFGRSFVLHPGEYHEQILEKQRRKHFLEDEGIYQASDLTMRKLDENLHILRFISAVRIQVSLLCVGLCFFPLLSNLLLPLRCRFIPEQAFLGECHDSSGILHLIIGLSAALVLICFMCLFSQTIIPTEIGQSILSGAWSPRFLRLFLLAGSSLLFFDALFSRSDSILSTDNSLRIGSMLAICTLLSIACMRYLPFLSVIVNTSFLSISIYGMLMSISFFAFHGSERLTIPLVFLASSIFSALYSFLREVYARRAVKMVLNLIPSNRRKSRGRHENVSSVTMLIGHMRGQSLASLALTSRSRSDSSLASSVSVVQDPRSIIGSPHTIEIASRKSIRLYFLELVRYREAKAVDHQRRKKNAHRKDSLAGIRSGFIARSQSASDSAALDPRRPSVSVRGQSTLLANADPSIPRKHLLKALRILTLGLALFPDSKHLYVQKFILRVILEYFEAEVGEECLKERLGESSSVNPDFSKVQLSESLEFRIDEESITELEEFFFSSSRIQSSNISSLSKVVSSSVFENLSLRNRFRLFWILSLFPSYRRAWERKIFEDRVNHLRDIWIQYGAQLSVLWKKLASDDENSQGVHASRLLGVRSILSRSFSLYGSLDGVFRDLFWDYPHFPELLVLYAKYLKWMKHDEVGEQQVLVELDSLMHDMRSHSGTQAIERRISFYRKCVLSIQRLISDSHLHSTIDNLQIDVASSENSSSDNEDEIIEGEQERAFQDLEKCDIPGLIEDGKERKSQRSEENGYFNSCDEGHTITSLDQRKSPLIDSKESFAVMAQSRTGYSHFSECTGSQLSARVIPMLEVTRTTDSDADEVNSPRFIKSSGIDNVIQDTTISKSDVEIMEKTYHGEISFSVDPTTRYENSTALQYDTPQFRPSNGKIFHHFSKQPSSELPSVLGAQPLVHIRHNSFDQPEFHGFRPRAHSSPGRNDISFESLASAIPFEDSGYGAHSLAADFEDLTGRNSDRESRKFLNETVEADAVDDSFDSAQKTNLAAAVSRALMKEKRTRTRNHFIRSTFEDSSSSSYSTSTPAVESEKRDAIPDEEIAGHIVLNSADGPVPEKLSNSVGFHQSNHSSDERKMKNSPMLNCADDDSDGKQLQEMFALSNMSDHGPSSSEPMETSIGTRNRGRSMPATENVLAKNLNAPMAHYRIVEGRVVEEDLSLVSGSGSVGETGTRTGTGTSSDSPAVRRMLTDSSMSPAPLIETQAPTTPSSTASNERHEQEESTEEPYFSPSTLAAQRKVASKAPGRNLPPSQCISSASTGTFLLEDGAIVKQVPTRLRSHSDSLLPAEKRESDIMLSNAESDAHSSAEANLVASVSEIQSSPGSKCAASAMPPRRDLLTVSRHEEMNLPIASPTGGVSGGSSSQSKSNNVTFLSSRVGGTKIPTPRRQRRNSLLPGSSITDTFSRGFPRSPETRKNESISKDGGIAGDMMVHRVTSMASASSVSVDLIRVDSPASNPNNSLHPSLGMSSFRSNQGLGFSPGGLLVPSYTSSFSRTRRSSVQRLSPYSTPAETRHGKDSMSLNPEDSYQGSLPSAGVENPSITSVRGHVQFGGELTDVNLTMNDRLETRSRMEDSSKSISPLGTSSANEVFASHIRTVVSREKSIPFGAASLALSLLASLLMMGVLVALFMDCSQSLERIRADISDLEKASLVNFYTFSLSSAISSLHGVGFSSHIQMSSQNELLSSVRENSSLLVTYVGLLANATRARSSRDGWATLVDLVFLPSPHASPFISRSSIQIPALSSLYTLSTLSFDIANQRQNVTFADMVFLHKNILSDSGGIYKSTQIARQMQTSNLQFSIQETSISRSWIYFAASVIISLVLAIFIYGIPALYLSRQLQIATLLFALIPRESSRTVVQRLHAGLVDISLHRLKNMTDELKTPIMRGSSDQSDSSDAAEENQPSISVHNNGGSSSVLNSTLEDEKPGLWRGTSYANKSFLNPLSVNTEEYRAAQDAIAHAMHSVNRSSNLDGHQTTNLAQEIGVFFGLGYQYGTRTVSQPSDRPSVETSASERETFNRTSRSKPPVSDSAWMETYKDEDIEADFPHPFACWLPCRRTSATSSATFASSSNTVNADCQIQSLEKWNCNCVSSFGNFIKYSLNFRLIVCFFIGIMFALGIVIVYGIARSRSDTIQTMSRYIFDRVVVQERVVASSEFFFRGLHKNELASFNLSQSLQFLRSSLSEFRNKHAEFLSTAFELSTWNTDFNSLLRTRTFSVAVNCQASPRNSSSLFECMSNNARVSEFLSFGEKFSDLTECLFRSQMGLSCSKFLLRGAEGFVPDSNTFIHKTEYLNASRSLISSLSSLRQFLQPYFFEASNAMVLAYSQLLDVSSTIHTSILVVGCLLLLIYSVVFIIPPIYQVEQQILFFRQLLLLLPTDILAGSCPAIQEFLVSGVASFPSLTERKNSDFLSAKSSSSNNFSYQFPLSTFSATRFSGSFRSSEIERKENAIRVRALLHSSSEGTAICDERGTVEMVNLALLNLSGYSEHELVGEDIKILMTPELQQVHDLYLYNYLSLGAARKKLVNNPRNTQVMTKAGRRVPVVVKVTEGEFGGKIFFAVFFEDKTRFASMQEHIRRSENRILEALNISPESIVVISAATRKISFLNRQILRMFGYSSAEEVLNKNISIFVPSPYQDRHDEFIHAWEAGEKSSLITTIGRDVYGLRQDGSTIPVHVYVCSGEAGGEKFYAAFLRNLSEQKEKEKEFTTKSDEFRSILSSCNDVAFLATNSRGEILLSNTAGLYNVLGWQSSELVTRSKSNRLQSVGDDSFGSLNRSTGIQPSGSSSGFVSSSQSFAQPMRGSATDGFTRHSAATGFDKELVQDILGWPELARILITGFSDGKTDLRDSEKDFAKGNIDSDVDSVGDIDSLGEVQTSINGRRSKRESRCFERILPNKSGATFLAQIRIVRIQSRRSSLRKIRPSGVRIRSKSVRNVEISENTLVSRTIGRPRSNSLAVAFATSSPGFAFPQAESSSRNIDSSQSGHEDDNSSNYRASWTESGSQQSDDMKLSFMKPGESLYLFSIRNIEEERKDLVDIERFSILCDRMLEVAFPGPVLDRLLELEEDRRRERLVVEERVREHMIRDAAHRQQSSLTSQHSRTPTHIPRRRGSYHDRKSGSISAFTTSPGLTSPLDSDESSTEGQQAKKPVVPAKRREVRDVDPPSLDMNSDILSSSTLTSDESSTETGGDTSGKKSKSLSTHNRERSRSMFHSKHASHHPKRSSSIIVMSNTSRKLDSESKTVEENDGVKSRDPSGSLMNRHVRRNPSMFGVSSLLNPLLDSASTMSKLSVSEGTVNSDTRAQSFEEQEVNYRVELLLSPERLIVDVHEEVTTVFIDIGLNLCPKNPTSKEGDHPHVHAKQWSFLDGMDREERIQKLSLFFSLLDEAVEQFQIERIKTVNTKYLACSNMYLSRPDHAAAVIDFALAFCSEVEDINRQIRQLHKSTQPYCPLRVRVGVNTGKLTSGVICTSLKAFDVYGDSLNVASRMMSSAEFGSIQLSDSTYHLVRDRGYRVEEKTVQVKGLGAMSTFIVLDRVTGLSIDISPFLAKPTRK